MYKRIIINSDHLETVLDVMPCDLGIIIEDIPMSEFKSVPPVCVAWNKGLKQSQETKDKISKSLLGRTISKEHRKRLSELYSVVRKGKNNPCAKKFKLISPSNKIFIVEGGFVQFCKDNNLSIENFYAHMRTGRTIVGKNLGWKIERL